MPRAGNTATSAVCHATMQWRPNFSSNASKAATLETITYVTTSAAQLFAAQLFKEIRNSIKILYSVSLVLST
jgi:hypothetical protein